MFRCWKATAMHSKPRAEIARGRIVPYAAVVTRDASTIETLCPGAAPASANTVEPSSPTSFRASVGCSCVDDECTAGSAWSDADVIRESRVCDLAPACTSPLFGRRVQCRIPHCTCEINAEGFVCYRGTHVVTGCGRSRGAAQPHGHHHRRELEGPGPAFTGGGDGGRGAQTRRALFGTGVGRAVRRLGHPGTRGDARSRQGWVCSRRTKSRLSRRRDVGGRPR